MSVYSFVGKDREVRQAGLELELACLVEQSRKELSGFALAAETWVMWGE